jgi:hypothetical protein
MSAHRGISDLRRGWREVRKVPKGDMAAMGKVQRIASHSDCAAAALCFRGELVLPNILIYAPTAGRAVALRRRLDAHARRNDEDGRVVA